MSQSSHLPAKYSDHNRPIAINSLSFEFGGNALIYSINYDRVLIQSDHYKGTIRIGAGILPYPFSLKENRVWLFVPIEYNNLFGSQNHFFELSLGTTYSSSIQGANHWITARAGYRLQPFSAGFFLRTGLVLLYIPYANPQLYRNEVQDVILPIPSLAIGMSF